MKFWKIFRVGFNVRSSERLWAILIFALIAGFFGFLGSINIGWVKIYQVFEPCGFVQKYDFPCPTCGFTRAMLEFARGNIWKSLYIQPAAGVFCLSAAIIGVFALLIGGLGLKFWFVDYIISRFKIGYIILAILFILAGGWAVMIARAISN